MLKILIVEGNVKKSREMAAETGVMTQSELYEKTLNSLADDLDCSIVCPADADAILPSGDDLQDFDGIVWTGSALNIYDRGRAIDRQINFMKSCFNSGALIFGSCWGLQVAVVATGGEIAANDKGRQIGIARDIDLTEAGRAHPLYKDKPPVFDAVNVHLDHTTQLPKGATILSRNDKSEVQAIEIKQGNAVFWGVQYHPEFDLAYMSNIIKRYGKILIDEGICKTEEDVREWAEDMAAVQNKAQQEELKNKYALTCDVLEPSDRLRELSNWIAFVRDQKIGSDQGKKISNG